MVADHEISVRQAQVDLVENRVVGVDLGVANLATDSDGVRHSGEGLEACRIRHHTQRRDLQKAAAGRKRRGRRPKAIRRKLRDLSGRESRFRKDINHTLSQSLVAKAQDTGCGLALEDLKGICDRTRFRKAQRARMGVGPSISSEHLSPTRRKGPG